MAAGRDAVRMTDEEITEFLSDNIKVQVATVARDGSPHLATLFYVLEEGKIAFWTYGRSQKILNLRRDDRITCLIEDGTDYFELRGMTISGHARLVEDYDELLDLGGRVAQRMAGGMDLGEMGEAIVAKQAQKRVGVIVEPTKITSWDHRKMTAPPGGTP